MKRDLAELKQLMISQQQALTAHSQVGCHPSIPPHVITQASHRPTTLLLAQPQQSRCRAVISPCHPDLHHNPIPLRPFANIPFVEHGTTSAAGATATATAAAAASATTATVHPHAAAVGRLPTAGVWAGSDATHAHEHASRNGCGGAQCHARGACGAAQLKGRSCINR